MQQQHAKVLIECIIEGDVSAKECNKMKKNVHCKYENLLNISNEYVVVVSG